MSEVKRLQGGIEVIESLINGGMEGKALIQLDKEEPAPDYMSHDSDGAYDG